MSDKKKGRSVQFEHLKDIKLLGDNIIVELYPEKEIGGIIIPTDAQEKTQKARVLKVGPGRIKDRDEKGNVTERWPLNVKEGDAVLLVKFAGSEVAIEQNKHLLLKGEEDILGKYVGNSPIDIAPFNNRVLVEWEFATDTFKGTNLKRPDGSAIERHYTGIIRGVGPDCHEEIKEMVGKRIFFWQFCGPERIDHGGKRYAFMYDTDIIMEIPTRKELEVLSQ